MKRQHLTTRPPFSTLFPIDRSTVAAIMASMEKNGYDPAEPIIAWNGTVIDGHTRLAAATELGLDDVAVISRTFESDAEALEYAIRRQRDRRNMSDAALLSCIAACDMVGHGGDRSKSPRGDLKTNAELSALTGKSERAVSRARRVLADPQLAAAVASGQKSIAAADREISAPPPPPRRKKSAVPTDPNGKPIPKPLVPLFQRQQEVTAIVASLRAQYRTLKAAEKERDPLYAQTSIASVLTEIKGAISKLENGVPAIICPYCHGIDGGCESCAGVGLMSKHRYDRTVPQEMKG